MTERPLPERHQRDLHIGRVPAREDGEVRPFEMRRRADRRQDVRGQGQVQHLLLDDVDESGFPRLDPRQLLGGDALRDAPLQRKLGVEVFAQEAVLQLTGLAQQVDELLPALNAKGWLRRLPVRRPPRRHRSIVVRPAVRWKALEYALIEPLWMEGPLRISQQLTTSPISAPRGLRSLRSNIGAWP